MTTVEVEQTAKDESDLTSKIADVGSKWARLNGLMKRSNNADAANSDVHIPFTAIPYVISLGDVSDILEIQPIINQLIYDMSRDVEFVESVVKRYPGREG